MIKRSDKKGQGLSTNAIILIVLGVFVLVIMIVGFNVGWDKIAPWLSKENVDSVVQGCETACTTQSVFAYCSKIRELNDGVNKPFENTCLNFSKTENVGKYGSYGVKPCPGLCPPEVPVGEPEATPEVPVGEPEATPEVPAGN